MKITEPARQIDVIHRCDVLVVGSGPGGLTRFEIEGRNQTMQAIKALRAYAPGCEAARLRNFGMSIGISPEFIDGYGILILPTTGRYLQIPYRAMLPKRVKNLLVAGRAIGGDRIAHAGTRNMACCAVVGQGAGIAAALSLKLASDLPDVPIAAIHRELDRQGVRHQ